MNANIATTLDTARTTAMDTVTVRVVETAALVSKGSMAKMNGLVSIALYARARKGMLGHHNSFSVTTMLIPGWSAPTEGTAIEIQGKHDHEY